MNNFGAFGEFHKINEKMNNISKKPLLESEEVGEAESNDMDNVIVPALDNDEYVPSKKKEPIVAKDETEANLGAAGNSPVEKPEAEPQLGSIGGFSSKSMSLHESFGEKDASDEDPMESAQTDASDVQSLKKVNDMFNNIFDKKFETPKTIKYDLDATKAKSIVSDERIKLPRGW